MMKKFQNPDGNLPYLNEDGDITYDINPAGIAAAGHDKIKFFEDYADRYNRFNNKNRTKRILNTIKNYNAIVNDSFFGSDTQMSDAAGYYSWNSLHKVKQNAKFGRKVMDDVNTSTGNIPDRIYLTSYSDDDVYTHELVHKLNDSFIPRLRRSRQEKKLVNDAYSLGNFGNPYSKRLEQFTTNTQLRDRISADHNNVLGSDLNDVINNMSYDDLYNYVQSTNGYVGFNDYDNRQLKDGITDAKSAYNNYIQSKRDLYGSVYDGFDEVSEDSPYFKFTQMSKDDYINERMNKRGLNASWKDLSRQDRRDWKQNFKNNTLPSNLYNEGLDTKKLDAVKQALINVAKLGGKISK